MLNIKIQNISKKFNSNKIFEDINLEIENSQSLVVTGPNGSGKSTLLKIIAGLMRPTKGSVLFFENGTGLSPAQARNLIGFISADLKLYNELTAFENMEFFSRIRGLDLTEEHIRDNLSFAGLASRDNEPVKNFSSGMRQRLKLAFAVLNRPAALILDEPFTNLDDRGASIVREIMAEQKKRGVLILATSNPGECPEAERTVDLGK
jgi:heme exporter protein A